MEKKKFGDKKDVLFVNSITATRFLGSFLIIPIFSSLGSLAAAIFSAIFLLTDWIDGFFARKLNASTFFGALFDGTCDKTLGIISFLLLMSINPVVFSIPLLLEMGIIITQKKKLQNGLNVQSNAIGKLKTWFLSISMVGSFLAVDLLNMPPILDYIKYYSLDKLAAIKDFCVLLGISLPTIVMEAITLHSYNKELKNGVKEQANTQELAVDEEKINSELEKINHKRKELESQKSLLEQAKIIMDAMFDPEYYAENKDMPIQELKRELLKNGKTKR